MGSQRAERLAENESLFRIANERIAGWEEREASEASELYYCECGNVDCREKASLRKADYERVRADPSRFFVIPGHEIHDVEKVIEAGDGWVMVEKDASVRETVEATDPRS